MSEYQDNSLDDTFLFSLFNIDTWVKIEKESKKKEKVLQNYNGQQKFIPVTDK